MIRRLSQALIALLLAATAAGCAGRNHPAGTGTACGGQDRERPAAIAVLTDLTGSTVSLRAHYQAEFEKLINAVREGDLLVGLEIGPDSAVAPTSFELLFSATDGRGRGNAYTRRVALQRQRAEALEHFRHLASETAHARPGTAILDAIEHAAEHLALVEDGSERLLYLLSDMIEQSELADFTGADEASLTAFLAELEASGRLPALGGVRVRVTGVGNGDDAKLASPQVAAIRRFWQAYFEAAGARLEWYGPSLSGCLK